LLLIGAGIILVLISVAWRPRRNRLVGQGPDCATPGC
jgi:hypothetical protein